MKYASRNLSTGCKFRMSSGKLTFTTNSDCRYLHRDDKRTRPRNMEPVDIWVWKNGTF